MHPEHPALRLRFVALEEGGLYDGEEREKPLRLRGRRRYARVAASVCVAIVCALALRWASRFGVEQVTRLMLRVHGGVCATPADAALALGAPGWLASALPSVVVFQNSTVWWPLEVGREGRVNSVEQSRRCGNREHRRVRAALVEVQFWRTVFMRARRTFRGVEAACVQKAMDGFAGKEVCVQP